MKRSEILYFSISSFLRLPVKMAGPPPFAVVQQLNIVRSTYKPGSLVNQETLGTQSSIIASFHGNSSLAKRRKKPKVPLVDSFTVTFHGF